MIGMVCEMLAYYSEDTTIPAYYDLCSARNSRATPTRKMLD